MGRGISGLRATASGDLGRPMSSSALFAKCLSLNGKIREGRSRLPGDRLPPPKRDGQAFAESSANAVDDAHRGRRCRAKFTTTLHRRPICVIPPAIDPSAHLAGAGSTDCRLALLRRLARSLDGRYLPVDARKLDAPHTRIALVNFVIDAAAAA